MADHPESTGIAAACGLPVVAIVASAGGLRALSGLLAGLPADFPAAVLVVQHLSPDFRSHLAEIWARHTPLAVVEARDGDHLRAGTVFVAPSGQHMTLQGTAVIAMVHALAAEYLPPSGDRLFTSVAAACGTRATAVVLTGRGCDGAAGMREVKRRGGTVIVQQAETSEYPDMPRAAINTGDADYVLALGDIAACLTSLIHERVRQ